MLLKNKTINLHSICNLIQQIPPNATLFNSIFQQNHKILKFRLKSDKFLLHRQQISSLVTSSKVNKVSGVVFRQCPSRTSPPTRSKCRLSTHGSCYSHRPSNQSSLVPGWPQYHSLSTSSLLTMVWTSKRTKALK